MAPSESPHRLKFFHGLGDVLVFRNILSLLPGPIELYLNPSLGQSALFHADSNVRVISSPPSKPEIQEVKFYMEFTRPCSTGSATKGRVCLEHEFGVFRPDYKFRPLPIDHLNTLDNEAVQATHNFLKGLGPYVVCHFQGTSNPNSQNPQHDFAQRSMEQFVAAGLGVVIVNYDYVYHHPANTDFSFVDQDQIRSTYQQLPMEVESLWTLIHGAKAFYGVDSGPLHLALCSSVPCTFIKHRTGFLNNFYDTGLDALNVVDTDEHTAIPKHLIPQSKITNTTTN